MSAVSTAGSSLRTLFAELPRRCALLLEDVDAVGMTQSRQNETEKCQAETGSATIPPKSTGNLSFSGLLNALDGVLSHEGRILIMTTNHINRLDPTLIQAGRVDRELELPHADKDVANRLFCMVFKQSKGDIPDPEKPAEAEIPWSTICLENLKTPSPLVSRSNTQGWWTGLVHLGVKL